MAPCRQLLLWSVPSIAVLLGIFWFKKKREYAKSDPGGRERLKSLKEELAEALNAQVEAQRLSPVGKADQSVIKSAPIDIIPNGSNSQRSSPFDLTDEEIDIEIDKIIRKKSLEKEKRMSTGFDSHNLVSKSCTIVPSFSVKKETQSIMCSPLKTSLTCEEKANSSSLDDEDSQNTCNLSVESDNLIQNISTKSSVTTEKANESNIAEDTTEKNNVIDDIEEPIDSNDNHNRFSTEQTRHISERDSANHSPVDPLLASPSMCHFSDNHSEVNSY